MAFLYVFRDIAFTSLLFKLASCIAPLAEQDFGGYVTSGWQKTIIKSALWLSYWWVQGMVFSGIFCLGEISYICDAEGPLIINGTRSS